MSQGAWNNEDELVNAIVKSLTRNEEKRKIRKSKIIREFEPGLGRVDVLCVWYSQRRLDNRLRTGPSGELPQFTWTAAYTMAYLKRRRWTTHQTLQEGMNWDRSKVERVTEELTLRGLIEQDGTKVKARANSEIWVLSEIEAYEAKLKRWRTAIDQATQHEWFASKSYIVMPEPSEKIKWSLTEECILGNIGVMLYRGKTESVLEVTPKRRALPLTHVGWYLNELILEEVRNAQLQPGHRQSQQTIS